MDKELKKIQQEIKRLKEKSKINGIRYSKKMKDFAVAYGNRQLAAGVPLYKSAKELGIAEVTLKKWVNRNGSDFREVQVQRPGKEQPTDLVTLVSPHGFRLEGLTVKSAALLLLELG